MVMGLGVTGIPAAKKLKALGNDIIAIDNNAGLDRDKICSAIGENGKGSLRVMLAGQKDIDISILDDIGLIIASPGIASENSILKAAISRKIVIWDEIELSWQLLSERQKANTIAITGTNGKTTVVNLIGAILSGNGMDVHLCGNVGSPLLSTFNINKKLKMADDDDYMRVIEISSFQLERIYTFSPHIAILLNITSDHMDRHNNIDEYADMKLKLFSNQRRCDHAIINIDDMLIADRFNSKGDDGPALIKYSIENNNESHIWTEKNNIHFDLPSYKGTINIEGALLQGMHNTSNIMAASAAALICKADPLKTERSIKEFKPLSHRMEYLGEIENVRCINDSKATNPDSTIAALNGCSKEVTLIMGGKDKDMDFRLLTDSLDMAVNELILIGESAPRIEKIFKGQAASYNIYKCKSLKEAVELGFKITAPGNILLLSPACASMDMFRDYKDRGNKFKNIVMSFKE